MPANFLHGLEVIETTIGPLPVTVVKSAIIGLIGSAPMFAATGALQRWNGDTVYALGAQILDSNGNVQQVTVAGTSISTDVEPAWATVVGTTTTDGTVTWKCVQLAATLGIVNNPTLVGSVAQAAAFGPMIQGFSVPYALSQILEQGSGQIIVINVFDITKHNTTIAAAPYTMPASGVQAISLGRMGVGGVKVTNVGATVTYINGTDFTLDQVNGVILAKNGGAITVGEALLVTFTYADPSKVADSDLVGSYTGGVYTGIQALKTTYNTMGFWAKILIAPPAALNSGGQTVGSADATVAAALDSMAQTIRAMALVDAPPATPIATATSNRGLSGNAFNTSSKRTILCYSNLKFQDLGIVPTGITFNASGAAVQNVSNTTVDGPYTPWMAGCMANKDITLGYWYSPSNTPLTGPLGADVSLYSSAFDAASDTNNLNAAGIVTVFNAFGLGLRVWGNRSAAYPSTTAPDQFIPIRRTMDVLEESLELFALQFLDGPITNALITAIVASANGFVKTLVQRGALVGGSVSYDPGDNPAQQIANGQLVFRVDVMPPPPAERLTFQTTIDITLLNQLGTNSVQV
jgi:phage tail sheath protein FI